MSEKIEISLNDIDISMDVQNSDINYTIIQKTNRSLNDLETFLSTSNYITPFKSPFTNIIDQNRRRTFCLPYNPEDRGYYDPNDIGSMTSIDKFFYHLEACRRDNIPLCFSERQYFTIPHDYTKIRMPNELVGNISSTEPLGSVDNEPLDSSEPLDSVESVEPLDSVDSTEHDSTGPVITDDHLNREVDKSCVEYDFDIYLGAKKEFDSDIFQRMLLSFTSQFVNTVDWLSCKNPGQIVEKRGDKLSINFNVALLRKPQRRITDMKDPAFKRYGECWKESFHFRIYIKISKELKLFIRKRLLEDEAFQDIFGSIGMLNTLEDAFDKSIISNPIMFAGSMKRTGSIPHELQALYQISYKSVQPYPMIKKLTDLDPIIVEPEQILDAAGRRRGMRQPPPIFKYNVCYELSVNFEVPGGLIQKRCFNPIPVILADISAYSDRIEDGVVSDADISEYENAVETLACSDFGANYLKTILDIIARHRAVDYSMWKTIICALARKNQSYKPLAILFSLRHARSFLRGGMAQIDGLFEWIKTHQLPPDGIKPITIQTIAHWAKEDDPIAYIEAQNKNMFMKLQSMIFEYNGQLNETQIASVLKEMFGHKFKCDTSKNTLRRGIHSRTWREFVFPEDDPKLGQLYKWRNEEERPDTLIMYIGEKFPIFLNMIIEYCDKRIEEASANNSKTADQKAKEMEYFENTRKGVKKTQFRLGGTGFQSSIITACTLKFRMGNRGFEDSIDSPEKTANYIGVLNGVLQLYPKLKLIQKYHEIPISKSVNVDYVPYDPKDEYIARLGRELLRIFADDNESFEFWMMYIASGLDDRPRNPRFFSIWVGGGAQGKSVISELDLNTFGIAHEGGYAAKMDVGWFCSDRKGVGPDSALASTKKARRIWTSETEPGQIPRMSKIKEMLSEKISGNDKNEKQETWKVNAHITVQSNHEMRIEGRDYGTWRRILYYHFLMTFKQAHECDPNDPYQYPVNTDIMDKWVEDPMYQRAYFSILLHYYEILRDKYNGDLRKVPKHNIDRQTIEYAKRQDTITQFVFERIIHIGPRYPDTDVEVDLVSLTDLTSKYVQWHIKKFGPTQNIIQKEVREHLKSHYHIKKYFKSIFNEDYIREHKILDTNENYISAMAPKETPAQKFEDNIITELPPDSDPFEPESTDELDSSMTDTSVITDVSVIDDDSWLES